MSIRELFGGHQERPRNAFVLGGGGNLGSIQVGQLRALFEAGIYPDVVIGCSVGALNASAVAGNPTLQEVERLTNLWKSLTRDDIFPGPRFGRGPWMFIKRGVSAFSNDGLRNVIDHWVRFHDFSRAAVPFWVVATSCSTGLESWFTGSGDVKRALLASTALPGVFPPVTIDGEPFMDGGVVNNVPISKAIELGAERIFVLDVGNLERERSKPRRPFETLLQAVSIARAHRFRVEVDRVPKDTQLIRMPVFDVGDIRFDDFSRTDELMERAYSASRSFLDHPAQTGRVGRTQAS